IFYTASEADWHNPEIAPDLRRYFSGRAGVSAEERVRLFKLAWDVCGEAFSQRMSQYCRFYGGDPIRIRALYQAVHPDRRQLGEIVERALGRREEAPLPLAMRSRPGPPGSPPPK